MPCRSEYMEPTAKEIESKLVAELLVYVMGKYEVQPPDIIIEAASQYYGNMSKIDYMTAMLCRYCKTMTEEAKSDIMYDGRIKQARLLAEWWERHQEFDRARKVKEDEEARLARVRQKALAKLTVEEVLVLGIKDEE